MTEDQLYFGGALVAGAGAGVAGLIGVAGRGVVVPAPEPVVAAGGVDVLLAVLVDEPPQ